MQHRHRICPLDSWCRLERERSQSRSQRVDSRLFRRVVVGAWPFHRSRPSFYLLPQCRIRQQQWQPKRWINFAFWINFKNPTLMDSASPASFDVKYLIAAALSGFPATITPVVFMTHSATQHAPFIISGPGGPGGGGLAVSQVLKTSWEMSSGIWQHSNGFLPGGGPFKPATQLRQHSGKKIKIWNYIQAMVVQPMPVETNTLVERKLQTFSLTDATKHKARINCFMMRFVQRSLRVNWMCFQSRQSILYQNMFRMKAPILFWIITQMW